MLKKLQRIKFNYLRLQDVYFLRQKASLHDLISNNFWREKDKWSFEMCNYFLHCPLYESDHDKK